MLLLPVCCRDAVDVQRNNKVIAKALYVKRLDGKLCVCCEYYLHLFSEVKLTQYTRKLILACVI